MGRGWTPGAGLRGPAGPFGPSGGHPLSQRATPTPQPFRDGDHACELESPEDLEQMIFILYSEGCELSFAELRRELKNYLKLH